MKNLLPIFTLLLLFPAFNLLAQEGTPYVIKGTLEDDQNKPVPFGNVALYSQGDSALIGGAVSDETGKFGLEARPGQYFLKITYVSYQDKVIPSVLVVNQDLDLGTIRLSNNSRILDEVVVTGAKSQMELQLDKRIFNVAKDLSNIGSNASEILNNLPSVNVDIEGNVSLRGSQNVRILIDGKQSGLVGISGTDALRQLQGNMIESIEVITNPSSRYDAEGEVGIINIVLKKERKDGLNGSYMATLGVPSNYGGSFNMNYRKNKINLIGNYSVNYRANPGGGNSRQTYLSSDTSFVYEQNQRRTRSGLGHNVLVGMDYFLNDHNVLTGTFLIRKSRGLNTSRIEYRDFNQAGLLTRTSLRNEREEEPETNAEATLRFRRTYAEHKGRSLSFDARWILSEELELARYNEGLTGELPTIQQRVSNSENERNALIQLDYVHPFSKKGKFEAGLKSSNRLINNEFLLEQQNDFGSWATVPAFNNNLTYTENIHAGYLMAGNEFGKFSIQTGLRGELSDIKTELAVTREVNPRLYFNFFPSVHLSYKLSDQKTMQLSYSYRISRPGFRELIPFSNFSDSRVFYTGNPNLNPEYTHSWELGYLRDFGKGSLLTSVYYRHRLGVIQRITTVDSTGFTRIRPINLATEDAYGLELSYSYDLLTWWKVNANANLYRAITEGTYQGERLFSDTFTWNGRMTSRMTLFKNVDFQASLNYQAPRITPQGKQLSMYFIDLGFSRDILKGKGTLTASVRDLFNSRKERRITDNNGYYSVSTFQWRARQALFTFSYRLNRSKEKSDMREGGMGDEF